MSKRLNGGSSSHKEAKYKSHYSKLSAKRQKKLTKIIEELEKKPKGNKRPRKYKLGSHTSRSHRDSTSLKYQIIRVK